MNNSSILVLLWFVRMDFLEQYPDVMRISFRGKTYQGYYSLFIKDLSRHHQWYQYDILIMTYYHISIHLFQFFNCLHTIILLVTIIIHLQNQLMSLWYVLPRNKSTAKNSHFVKICIPVCCLWHCAQSGNTYIFYLAVKILE
jgi:hypothetical protein